MGFFSDLKEDLAMAVNELIPDEEELIRETEPAESVNEETPKAEAEGVAENSEESAVQEVVAEENLEETFELDKMLEKLDSMDLSQDLLAVGAEEAEQALSAETDLEKAMELLSDEEESVEELLEEPAKESIEETVVESIVEEEIASATEEMLTLEEEPVLTEVETIQEETVAYEEKTQDEGMNKVMESTTNRVVSDETAVITQGMAITGDIISEGSVDLIGSVTGNIDILGKLNVTGTINGNSKASEIYADNAKITGEVVSEGSVKIGQSSVIIGNITATSAVIAGAVKGDIDVHGPVILDTSAIVMGNIKSKSVQINNGAVIEGMCSQCYAEVNPTSFFEDFKKNK